MTATVSDLVEPYIFLLNYILYLLSAYSVAQSKS
jgi:hypothetical protein